MEMIAILISVLAFFISAYCIIKNFKHGKDIEKLMNHSHRTIGYRVRVDDED
jgi:hypothetical protein